MQHFYYHKLGLPPVAELIPEAKDMPRQQGTEMSKDRQTSVVIKVVKKDQQ